MNEAEMKVAEKEKQASTLIRDWIILGVVVLASAVLLFIFPHKLGDVAATSRDYLIEMVAVLPAIMIIMGLFAIWIPKEIVVKYLGKTSGIKGILLALFLGALPTGPLYIAFPIAAGLIKKGARISNIIVFLSAWACLKIPQEIMELQFLGWKFMALRIGLTVVFVVLMGLFMEKIIEVSEKKPAKSHEKE